VIAGLVLAAGAGERFGGRKQLAELDGRPLLEHALAAMESAPVAERIVVLGAYAAEVLESVNLHGARPIVCAGWSEGIAASLRTGIDAVGPEIDAVVIPLGDQPHVEARAIAAVIAARGGGAAAVRATYGGVPSHPALIERTLFDTLRGLRGDIGARDVFSGVPVTEVPCDGLGDPADVDVPDDLSAAP
jgi:molybdenum cofactor cytidylyltransferase